MVHENLLILLKYFEVLPINARNMHAFNALYLTAIK